VSLRSNNLDRAESNLYQLHIFFCVIEVQP